MKSFAALVAIAVLLLTGPAGTASAQTPAPALQLTLADAAPRVVTADGPDTLTVAGTLRNTGSIAVSDLVVRMQRSEPLRTQGEVRDALDGNAATDGATPQFTPLAAALAPGQEVPVQLRVPLRGPATTSLALGATGTYEVLVNVNGSPSGGTRARLAAVRMLLPVLSLPAGGGFRTDTGATRDATSADPSPFTLLYPIAEVPRRLATVPGAPVLLSDDTLAASFGPSGRLGGLVTAIAQQAPAGSRVRAATCLAIDPDLVETAAAMSQPGGYRVAAPDGSTVPGTGSAAAGQWLAQLRSVARGGCVVAIPYADADLVALTRGGLSDAAARALTAGRQIVADVLQTSVNPVVWPADGVLDEPTAQVVAGTGATTVVLSADGVAARAPTAAVPVAGTPLSAVLADPLLLRAAAGPAGARTAPGPGVAAAAATSAGTDTALSTQDTIGALAFQAAAGRPLVLAPPHRWATDGAGATALLAAVDQLIGAGALTPQSLADTAADPTDGRAEALDYPLSAGSAELPPAAVATIATAAKDLAGLRAAVVPDSGVGIGADELFTPLDMGLLRPASAARRGDPVGAQDAAAAALATVGAIRGSIRVLEPPSPYFLGTSTAPLPLTVANGLPVTVRVRVEIASTSGLRVAPIDMQQIPPLGRRQVSVNAQVTRSGQFVVAAVVRTPDGGLLGPPSRLRVQSTAYGTITGWLTAIAGGILVLLVARRIWRRARGDAGRPTDRVDPTPPPPTPQPPLPPAPLPPAPTSRAPTSPAPTSQPPMSQPPTSRPTPGPSPAEAPTARLPAVRGPARPVGAAPPDRDPPVTGRLTAQRLPPRPPVR